MHCGLASGVAGDRGWRSGRPQGTARSAAGQVVKGASFARSAKESEPASPGHGRAAPACELSNDRQHGLSND
jgi:hypothetical protein